MLFPQSGVNAPRPGARGREIEPDKTVQRSGRAAVDGGPEALRGVELEIRDRHLAGKDKGDRAGEQPQKDEAPTGKAKSFEAPARMNMDAAAMRSTLRICGA